MTSCRILVVDDNVDAADMTRDLLQSCGFHTEIAYGGREALIAARAYHPTLIFLDIGMPIMDGYEVATAIRADEILRRVTLVALTAWGDEASRERIKNVGFDIHLVKPASMKQLLDVANAVRRDPARKN